MRLIKDFFLWWKHALYSACPSWLRIAFLGQTSTRALYFDPKLSEIETKGQQIGVPRKLLNEHNFALGKVSSDIGVDVIVPDDLLLARVIKLPKKAGRNLASFATLDLLQRTPFDKASAVWAMGKQKRQGTDVVATQWVLKRSDSKAIQERLAALGLLPRRLVVSNGAETIVVDDVGETRTHAFNRWVQVNLTVLAATIGVLVYHWLEPAFNASRSLSQWEQNVAALRAETLQLRRSIEETRSQRTSEDEIRRSLLEKTNLVEVLRETTVSLTDEAWLSSISFQNERLVLSGETSGTAVEEVLSFSKSNFFGDARLSGPTSATTGGGERFEIAVVPK